MLLIFFSLQERVLSLNCSNVETGSSSFSTYFGTIETQCLVVLILLSNLLLDDIAFGEFFMLGNFLIEFLFNLLSF